MLANNLTILEYMLTFLVFAQLAQYCNSFGFYLEDINSYIYVETMDNSGLEWSQQKRISHNVVFSSPKWTMYILNKKLSPVLVSLGGLCNEN